VRLWDVGSGQELRSFTAGTNLRIAFAPDGKTLISSSEPHDAVVLWSVATGQELRRFGGHPSKHPSFAISPDGRRLATGDRSGLMYLWDVNTGRRNRTVGAPMPRDPRSAFPLVTVAFSPDGRTLAAGYSDETVRLWEVASGHERGRFHGHRDAVVSLAFS